jgi:hypothetical protein
MFQQSQMTHENVIVPAIEPEEKSVSARNEPAFFPTFTWRDWHEIEVLARKGVGDFLVAMEEGQINRAIMAVMDLQEVAAKLLAEIFAKGVVEGIEAEEALAGQANLDVSV